MNIATAICSSIQTISQSITSGDAVYIEEELCPSQPTEHAKGTQRRLIQRAPVRTEAAASGIVSCDALSPSGTPYQAPLAVTPDELGRAWAAAGELPSLRSIGLGLLGDAGLEVDIIAPSSSFTLEQVVGSLPAKQALRAAMGAVQPGHASAAAAARVGIVLPAGVLLHGPPGTGKTMMAAAAASEAGAHFIAVPCPALLHAEVGRSQQAIAQLFTIARAASPCVLFFDELQAVFRRRDSQSAAGDFDGQLLAQLLVEMSAKPADGRVCVIGATNLLGALDEALLRPGRFDAVVHVPPPGAAELVPYLRQQYPAATAQAAHDCAAQFDGATVADVQACIARARRQQVLLDAKPDGCTMAAMSSSELLAWCGLGEGTMSGELERQPGVGSAEEQDLQDEDVLSEAAKIWQDQLRTAT